MKRREFIKLSGGASLGLIAGRRSLGAPTDQTQTFYVATDGEDERPGTQDHPFATLHRAQQAVRTFRGGNPEIPVKVVVRQGTYYLGTTLILTAEDSGTAQAPVTYAAYPDEKVTLSGGRKLNCRWQARKKSKDICDLTAGNSGPFAFTQLFVNGKRQVRARYPDIDPSNPGKSSYVYAVRGIPAGTSSPDPQPENDAAVQHQGVIGIEFDPNTFTQKRWAKPEEAVIHLFPEEGLGNLEWKIRSIDYDRNLIWFDTSNSELENRWIASSAIGKQSRFFVDNVYEEMNAPQEWYLSTQSATLYYRPEDNLDMESALIEVPVLEQIIRAQGTEYVSLDGFRFAHTETTYMKQYESSPTASWSVYRGGAIFFEQTRNCSIKNCWFDAVGGNAVFWSDSNLAGSISGCTFTEAGDNAICFAGKLGQTSSTKSEFPIDCVATNNLIHDCGVFGKQTAGIYISRGRRITADHNHIHNMPCSAICIVDSGWGGHLIEHNDLHDTVKEVKHHGALTAWGNHLERNQTESPVQPEETALSAAAKSSPEASEPVIFRNNLIRGDSDYGILLAHGSTNHEVYNNVAVGSAIALFEGAHRNIYNNIWYDSDKAVTFQIGNLSNEDRYHHNIAAIRGDTTYSLSTHPSYGQGIKEIDYNCVFQDGRHFSASVSSLRKDRGFTDSVICTLADWQKLGFDQHSAFSNPLFADPSHLDFRLLEASPALKLGFANFAMNQWGLTKDFTSIWKDA
jgi:hypothetical protein